MKLHLYRKTVKLQLYGMINTLQLIFMATLATNGLAMTDSPSESPPDKIIIRHTEVEVEEDRYFKLDKTKKESILDQFRTQATEIYHAYKDHCINQKKFLEMLVIKDKTVKPDELQSVHPWFKGWPNEIIRSTLNRDIIRHTYSISILDEFIQELTSEKETVDSLFIEAFNSRRAFLINRQTRRAGVEDYSSTKSADMLGASGYEKCCANYAIMLLRLYDEIIFALFPHISWEVLQSSSVMTPVGKHLLQDISLMQFLSGEKKMPLDPDTVMSQIISSKIPKQNQNLYNALLASKVIYLLPEPVRQFEKKQTKKKKSAKTKKNNFQKTAVLIPSSLTAISVAPTATKKKTVKRERVIVPAGGWSTHDKTRSSEAVTKKQTHFIKTKNERAVVQTAFQPATEITLTDSQYDTLQAIRSPTTPEYTLTYDPVVSLLEAIGIIVDRKSGSSHAHISTPGHNMKILMEPHGWTDAYGHKTMTKLRNLMRNLNLNDNKFIKDRD